MIKPEIKVLFGKRLQQARKMEGLSLRALSDKIGGAVTHTALAKYEHGDMMPDGETFAALVQALNQEERFFFRPMEAPLADMKFRAKQPALGEKDIQSLKVRAQSKLERYFEIERLLGEVTPFKNPLRALKLDYPEDAEKAAEKVRKVWELGTQPIGNFMQILESHGVKVTKIQGHPDFDGFSGWIGKHPIIVLNEALDNPLRKRHTLMHELGHLLLKGHLSENLIEEKAVGRFAAAFTIPQREVKKLIGGKRQNISMMELRDIKLTWGISMTSFVMRAYELGYLSRTSKSLFWDQWGTKWVKAKGEPFDDEYQSQEYSHRFQRLVYRAVSEGEITQSKATELLEISLDDLRAGINLHL
jgi:Zn-dependent peptidase ImmA (M78 family)